MIKKILLLTLTLLFVLSCTQQPLQEPETFPPAQAEQTDLGQNHYLTITNNQFQPLTLEAKISDQIEWLNQDSTKHSITFEDGRLDEDILPGETAFYLADEAGEFRYFCRYHPGMQGTIIVS